MATTVVTSGVGGTDGVAPGTSGNLLTSDGTNWTSAAAAGGGFTLGTEQATTSGTSITFGSIPAGTTTIHVNFVGVSTDGTQELQLRIGDAGGIETSGYISGSVRVASSAHDIDSDSGCFKVSSENAAGDVYHGTMILSLEDATAFTWCSFGVLNHSGSATGFSAGSKSLSAELTQIYLWAAGDDFDAGAINIMYQ